MAETGASDPSHGRFRPAPRGGTRVTYLELFFDLVFVLAFTQCTTLMVEQESWAGMVQGLFALALLWWSWAAYAWLTNTIDPEQNAVRIALFGAMAALLVVALTVPEAFGELALAFALAYGVVRVGHLALYVLASRGDPGLRSSVSSLAVSSAIAIGLLTGASFLDGVAQGALWALAILVDFGGPAVFGVAGWRLVPAHFAERHGKVIILALGESIVVLGVGVGLGFTAAVLTAVVLGVALASALWWVYFDVVAPTTEQRLLRATEGRERNALARDSYSYLHLPMTAGVVLVAVGLESTLTQVGDPLDTIPASALLGGVALYLIAHVALRLRGARTINHHRLVVAVAMVALIPVAVRVPAIATLAGVTVVLWVMIAVETAQYGAARTQLRQGLPVEPDPGRSQDQPSQDQPDQT